MDESRLDQDLRALSKRPRPDLPAGFNEMVLSQGSNPRDSDSGATGELAYDVTFRISDAAVGSCRFGSRTSCWLDFRTHHGRFSSESD